MIALIVWVACAIACGVIASNKGRNVAGWVVLGILFGIFAVLVLAFLKPLTGTGKLKKCPYCQSTIDIHANKCPHCQSDLVIEKLNQ